MLKKIIEKLERNQINADVTQLKRNMLRFNLYIYIYIYIYIYVYIVCNLYNPIMSSCNS